MSFASYVFATCQVGAEGALKQEAARDRPDWRLAFSRPGFVTFKLPVPHTAEQQTWQPTFARVHGQSLGKAEGSSLAELAAHAAGVATREACRAVHVYPRDRLPAGLHGYLPGPSPESIATAEAIDALAPPDGAWRVGTAASGERVLDVVLLEPDQWWLGWHAADCVERTWPGGFCPLELPEDAVSRAWLKLEEAVRWSGLPLKAGGRAAEIGCAPGGAAQALLARGLIVTGIDPALVDPRVAGHPNFTHVRKRGHEVRRREFRKTRWLLADLNVAPGYTLDTVEAIVTHAETEVRGLLLTLKLLEWSLSADVPAWEERVRSWGFAEVRTRQLQHNRQEVCLAAWRKKTNAGNRFRQPV